MEKDQVAGVGVEHAMQRAEEGGDEELAFFPGISDQGASEDFKRMRMCWGSSLIFWLMLGAAEAGFGFQEEHWRVRI
jgi:hypothetical protein